MRNKSTKQAETKGQVNFNRLSHLAQSKATKITLMPEYKKGKRLQRTEIEDEFKPAVAVTKAMKIGWAQRTKCGQKWVAYCPFTHNDFRAKQTPTMREAVLVLAGWLGLTQDETLNIL